MKPVLIAAALTLLAAAAHADELLERGKEDFNHLCAPCHGENGKGQGPQAAHLEKKPADLTMITARYGLFPEERVFDTIAGIDMPMGHGSREMPIWGDIFVTEDVGNSTSLDEAKEATDDATRRILGLVAYIETIQVKP